MTKEQFYILIYLGLIKLMLIKLTAKLNIIIIKDIYSFLQISFNLCPKDSFFNFFQSIIINAKDENKLVIMKTLQNIRKIKK